MSSSLCDPLRFFLNSFCVGNCAFHQLVTLNFVILKWQSSLLAAVQVVYHTNLDCHSIHLLKITLLSQTYFGDSEPNEQQRRRPSQDRPSSNARKAVNIARLQTKREKGEKSSVGSMARVINTFISQLSDGMTFVEGSLCLPLVL